MFESLLNPVHFFAFQIDCHPTNAGKLEKKHLLPDLSSFHGSLPFAEVAIGWHEKGIHLTVSVQGRFDQPTFPHIGSADSIELFIDTRDVKTAGFPTRFCHHFYFLPDPVEDNGESIQAEEITHFRTDDKHELCDASLLQVSSEKEKKRRRVNIFIPSDCLHGYDPTQFDRLGFTYRINRIDGSEQNFSANETDFSIESQPSLWASLKLVK